MRMPVGIVILLAAAAIGGTVAYSAATYETRRSNAETEAREWCARMYPSERAAVDCQAEDTDANGYVSCAVRVGERAPEPVECAAYVWFSFNKGCRPARLALPRRNAQ